MTAITLLIELEYDADLMHGDEPDGIAWFNNLLLHGPEGDLRLHSSDIGDEIGTVRVLRDQGQRIEAAARWMSQNLISGTKCRDPDSEPWGASGRKAWQAWAEIARGTIDAADN